MLCPEVQISTIFLVTVMSVEAVPESPNADHSSEALWWERIAHQIPMQR